MRGGAAVLAELFAVETVETPYGGRAATYEPMGPAWLKLGRRRVVERSEAGVGRRVDTVTAEARSDARLGEGRVLRFGGDDWRIRSVETVGGRAILMLEAGR